MQRKKGLRRSGFAPRVGKQYSTTRMALKPRIRPVVKSKRAKGTKRLPSIKSLKTRAWTAFAKYIRSLSPYCYTCDAPANQAGHYVHNNDKPNMTLGGNALWYNEKNVHNQCARCNLFMSGNLARYSERLEAQYGFGVIQELGKLHRTVKKWSREEVTAIAEKYEALNETAVLPSVSVTL